MPKIFKKRKSPLNKQIKQAGVLLKKLLSLKIVQIILITILILLLFPFVIFFILRPKVNHNPNYGITFSNKYAQEIGLNWQDAYIKILDNLKVKNLRLVVYWDEVETKKDIYDYSNILWQLDEVEKRGDINVILTMGRKVPRWPECFEPDWYKNETDQKIKDLELYEFIKQTTTQLKKYDSIVMWQVENEPFFPFGECEDIKRDTLKKEVSVVRSIDARPIVIQDSGEGGTWYPTYSLGDYLAISMYRKIWYDFWGVFLGKSIYFKYPLAHWTYKIKAHMLRVPPERIIVTELQAEPWGPNINTLLTQEQKNRTMSKNDFLDTISYAQKSGFDDLYLWGAEWWLWEKEQNNNSFYWDTAKALFK